MAEIFPSNCALRGRTPPGTASMVSVGAGGAGGGSDLLQPRAALSARTTADANERLRPNFKLITIPLCSPAVGQGGSGAAAHDRRDALEPKHAGVLAQLIRGSANGVFACADPTLRSNAPQRVGSMRRVGTSSASHSGASADRAKLARPAPPRPTGRYYCSARNAAPGSWLAAGQRTGDTPPSAAAARSSAIAGIRRRPWLRRRSAEQRSQRRLWQRRPGDGAGATRRRRAAPTPC